MIAVDLHPAKRHVHRHTLAHSTTRQEVATAIPFSAPGIASTTVSNVSGPTVPIYFAGARLQVVTGLGPLIGGLNLFHVVATWNGTISIGATADRSALPDPAYYADRTQTAFDEMLTAADRVPISS
jgi:diacylglycerol O-acyltransferase